MESDFIKDINNVLISEVVSQENGHTSEVHKIAKNCLKALMNFNSKEKKSADGAQGYIDWRRIQANAS